MKLRLMLSLSLVAAAAGQENGWCGVGTLFDDATGECLCDPLHQLSDDPNVIKLAGIFDTTTYTWGHDVFEVTVQLINRGFWDVLPEGTRLEYDMENSNCDESDAMRSYWKLRTANGNKPMHGIVGARCSGASMALARISGLEAVPQISAASNSALLSNSKEFPYFSRLVAPNDERGEVGATVAMLRAFGWERINIISTDTQFAKDTTTAFKKLWVGDHGDWFGQAYGDTVRVTPEGSVDEESVLQVLSNMPTDPSSSSRVILLAAHYEHAYPILEIAKRQNFQPDTIWVGPPYGLEDFSWLPDMPGYIGVAPFHNRDQNYDNFMVELQSYQRTQGKEVLPGLPTFAAETVDAIRALTAAVAASDDRRDGAKIVRRLRSLVVDDGVSGHVEFNDQGDRRDPLYSIFNLQPVDDGDGGATFTWRDIGVTGTAVGSAVLTNGIQSVCFAGAGCGLAEAPDDNYPPPPYKLPGWMIFLILFLVLVFVALVYVTLKYRSSRRSKSNIRAELESFRESVVGLRAAECKYIPHISKKSDDIEQARNLTAYWMWKETKHNMRRHSADNVFGNPNDCWVLYSVDGSRKLEDAYKKGLSTFSPLSGYVVDLKKLEQTNLATAYKRDVQRVLSVADTNDHAHTACSINLSDVEIGDAVPSELQDEPRMVFCEKDIIQISTQRPDGWAFGTKLHHTDEASARQLVALALGGSKEDEGRVFLDSGWFQLDKTRVPTPDDLAVVQQNVGDTGALDPPLFWDKVSDNSVVQKHELNPLDTERVEVEKAFLSSLDRNKVRVLIVERIQNLAMWQSYVVKRQTVCSREAGLVTGNGQDAIHQNSLKRFERKWLFHGTNSEVMDKILQQGFNRSFCGKNATMYGKGVYFARDAKYSSARLYAVPDSQGRQYIMACRVVAGEYCRGKTDALTPDIRDHKSHTLYDSTVDNVGNPSIYVTYHDAQAYPEYLITFKQ